MPGYNKTGGYLETLFTRDVRFFFVCLAFALFPVSAGAQAEFEVKADLQAASLLSPDLLKSDLYTIDELVRNDGLVNIQTVKSKPKATE